MSIFFTSDQHLGHVNIIRHCNRPFSNLLEMDETIIDRWNSVVTSKDTVFCLGDFCYKNHINESSKFSRLNGHKHLITGNHDNNRTKNLKWKSVVEGISQINCGVDIILCHYSMRSWNKSHRGSIHLFGHSHGKLPTHGKSFDVGVDCWDFTPVVLEKVIEFTNSLEEQMIYCHNVKAWIPMTSPVSISLDGGDGIL